MYDICCMEFKHIIWSFRPNSNTNQFTQFIRLADLILTLVKHLRAHTFPSLPWFSGHISCMYLSLASSAPRIDTGSELEGPYVNPRSTFFLERLEAVALGAQ
jgi:hypothetical protein